MRQKVAAPLLALVLFGLVLTHVQLQPTEQGTLVSIDGREVDLWGAIKNQWNTQTRNCKHVIKLSDEASAFTQAKSLIQAYSPPSSQSAQIASAWSAGSWMLIEVEFDTILPAVVTLKETQGEWSVVPNAIWSGLTHPWVAAPWIRNYLSKQAPDMPASLLACFTPHSKSFDQ
jgi:hypothetical protein